VEADFRRTLVFVRGARQVAGAIVAADVAGASMDVWTTEADECGQAQSRRRH
jgi:hypothetical protein